MIYRISCRKKDGRSYMKYVLEENINFIYDGADCVPTLIMKERSTEDFYIDGTDEILKIEQVPIAKNED